MSLPLNDYNRYRMTISSLGRSIAERIAERFGLVLIPRWRLPQRELATHLRRVFAEYQVKTVIDVGANRGQYRDFLRLEVEYGGVIHSFEPVSTLYEELTRRARNDPNWKVYFFALGDEDGETRINVMHDNHFSSLLRPRATGLNDYDVQNRVLRTQSVSLRRIDSLTAELPALAAAENIYLKMDTQGFDLQVLRGATQLLARTVAMQSEVSVIPLYDGMPDYRTSIDAFNAAGFDLSGLFPVSLDQALRVVEFDCVTVNRHHRNAASGVAVSSGRGEVGRAA